MQELTRIRLENEMDLILAHKRAMKVAELMGLSLSQQTSFATAVSEVSRNSLDNRKNANIILGLSDASSKEKYALAVIDDYVTDDTGNEGLRYAKRLSETFTTTRDGVKIIVELGIKLPHTSKADTLKLDEWRNALRNERALSYYDELKKKHEQLQELSERVQQSEQRYVKLTDALPLMIFRMDAEGDLQYANKWLRDFTGASIETLNATNWENVMHPDDIPAMRSTFEQNVTDDDAELKQEYRLKNKATGKYVWHKSTVLPQPDKGTRMWIGYIVDIEAQKVIEQTLRDNAELKATQIQLKDYQQRLENKIAELNRSNVELEQYAYIASHDLQEPLRKIVFYSDYILKKHRGSLDDSGVEKMQSVVNAAERMTKLLKDLLAFSKIRSEETKFDRVDLVRIAAEALQSNELTVLEKNATVEIDPLPLIDADETLMRQLFFNLISNALKYSRNGVPPKLKITAETTDHTVRLNFADNGIGIDLQHVDKMFELFRRLHARDEYQGSGIGLAVCKKIAELHGGSIGVTSNLETGSTFEVTLPIKQNVIHTN